MKDPIKIITVPYALSERVKALDLVRQLIIEGRQFAVDPTDRFINISYPMAAIREQPAAQ